MTLPLDALRSVAERELARAGAAPLFLTISGAHLYGFASPDSDFDVRGAHRLPLDVLLGLRPPRATVSYSGIEEGRELDVVSHEAGKYFRMLLNRNGYVMEQVFSPLVVSGGAFLDELRPLARGCLARGLHHHYRGFAFNERRFLEKEPTIKRLLYAYRVLLTGIHVLRTGEVEANLPALLEAHPQDPAVRDLIAAKTRERRPLAPGELEAHQPRLDALMAELDGSVETSRLPESPAKAAELEEFLGRVRG